MTRATNSGQMRQSNRQLVLNLIRSGTLSRADIAKKTGLTRAALTIIADELLQEGLILEEESSAVGVGRRPKILSLNGHSRLALGINITRRFCEIGLVTLTGEVLSSQRFDNRELSPQEAMERLMCEALSLLQGVDRDKLLGVGVTTPGPVDTRTLTILTPPNFEAWHGVCLAPLADQLGLPLYLENISSAYALCAKYFGKCVDEDNYIALLVDEGIGSGIVVGGALYRGATGLGSEIGHVSIDYNGVPCNCGNVGCLECYASIPAVLQGSEYSSWREVMDADAVALQDKEADYLSAALAGVFNLFDLDLVVLGGDLAYKGDVLAARVRKKLSRKVIARRTPAVICAKEPNGVLTAATAVIHCYFQGE